MARHLKTTLLVSAMIVLGILGFALRFPGLSNAVRLQVTDSGLRESRNNYRLLAYLAHQIGLLRLNPVSGYYDFEAARRAPASAAERGRLAYHVGDFAGAVRSFERAIVENGESDDLLFWLANAHLRLAEAENCLTAIRTGAPAQSMCALPLGRAHDHAHSSRAAAELFGRLAKKRPDDAVSRWLFNFSLMTLGEFPSAAPEELRIDSPFIEAFYGRAARATATANADLVFVDRAAALGVDTFDAGKGVAVEDFDHDGDFDIVTGGNFDPLRYYSNEGARGFLERSAAAGFGGITQVHIITAADYDNDGEVDLFVGRPFLPYLLLRNAGDGSFIDVTAESGLLDEWLEDEVSFTWASAWGDIDNDGDLDLFVARWGLHVPLLEGPLAQPYRGALFFRNDGGRFSEATVELGLDRAVRDQGIVGAAFGDYDNDGYVDLFVSSLIQRGSRLMRNLEGRSFARVGKYGPGFMASFVDVDHDGQLEIFHGGFTDARTSTEETVFGRTIATRAGRSVLLRRSGDDAFEVDSDFFAGGSMPAPTMGASYGDLDHDGCLDFYLGTGNPENWTVLPNLMFRGQPAGTGCADRTVNITMVDGFGNIQKGHGIVFFDFDSDGDQDIYSSLGGMWPGDRWPNQLFVNEGAPDNHWIKIRLRGRRSNSSGLGARISVTATAPDGEDVVRTFVMDHKTGFGSPPYQADIGLADAVEIRRVEVFWPASRCTTVFTAPLDSSVWLYEPACG